VPLVRRKSTMRSRLNSRRELREPVAVEEPEPVAIGADTLSPAAVLSRLGGI
jgi:hypothetical protein